MSSDEDHNSDVLSEHGADQAANGHGVEASDNDLDNDQALGDDDDLFGDGSEAEDTR